jgi:hypothetical protein
MRSAGNFSPEWGYLAPAPSTLRTVRVVLVATVIGATAGAGVVLSLIDHPTGDADRVAVTAHAIVTSAQAAPAMESSKVSAAVFVAPAAPPVVVTAAPNAVAPAKVTAVVVAPQVQAPLVRAASPLAQPDHAAQPSNVTQPVATSAQQSASAQTPPAGDAGTAPAAAQPASVAALSEAAPASSAAQDAPVVTSDASATDDGMGFVGPQQPQKKKHHTASGYKDGFPDISGPLRHLFSARNNGTAYYPNRAY